MGKWPFRRLPGLSYPDLRSNSGCRYLLAFPYEVYPSPLRRGGGGGGGGFQKFVSNVLSTCSGMPPSCEPCTPQAVELAAACRYSLALSYVDEDFLMQLEGRHLTQAQAIKIPIHLNMAACQLREGDPHTAVFNCSEVSSGARSLYGLMHAYSLGCSSCGLLHLSVCVCVCVCARARACPPYLPPPPPCGGGKQACKCVPTQGAKRPPPPPPARGMGGGGGGAPTDAQL